MSTATCEYDVTAQVPTTQSELVTALGDVDLDFSGLTALGASMSTDTTSTNGSTGAKRVIVFALSDAFNAAFPSSSAKKSVFMNYFTNTLSKALVSDVTAVDPVIS